MSGSAVFPDTNGGRIVGERMLRAAWIATVVAAGFGAAPTLRAQSAEHTVAGLDPAKLYDVRRDGGVIASSVQPDPHGVLRFTASGPGSFQILPVGIGDVVAPAEITDLVVTAAGETSVSLRWTAPGDDGTTGSASEYEISWATSPEGLGALGNRDPDPPTPGPPGSTETHTVSGLRPGTAGYVAVRTRDDVGLWSDLSNVVAFRTGGGEDDDVTPPGDVLDVVVRFAEYDRAFLAWTAAGDDGSTGQPHHYEVRASADSAAAAGWLGATELADLEARSSGGEPDSGLVVGLEPGATNYVAMRAVDEAGNAGAVSTPLPVRTTASPDVTPPSAVDLTVTEALPRSVRLGWTSSGDDGDVGRAFRYDLRYSTQMIDSAEWERAERVDDLAPPKPGGQAESVEVPGLSPDTRYYFAIVVEDEAGNASEMSAVVDAITLADDSAPLLPPSRPAARFLAGAVELTWEPLEDPGVAGYHVYRRPEGESETLLTPVPIEEAQYSDDSVEEGRGYFYRVTAVDAYLNESPRSAETWIRATGVSPALARIESIFPNPVRVRGTIRFLVPEVGPGHPDGVHVVIDLYDVAGRRVSRVVDDMFPPGVREAIWKVRGSPGSIAPGLYVSVLQAAGQQARMRVAVSR